MFRQSNDSLVQQRPPRGCSTILRLALIANTAIVIPTSLGFALELDAPDAYHEKQLWTEQDLGLPNGIGDGLFFGRQGEVLHVVSSDDALYSLDVRRDLTTAEITSFANPQPAFVGDGTLSAGWEYGPQETLFYTYGAAELLAQRPGGVVGAEEQIFELWPTGLLNASAAGVAFSPYLVDPNTGFGMLQLSDWSLFENRVWNVPLLPLGNGFFEPGQAEILVEFPGEKGFQGSPPSVAGDIEYIPSGPHAGDLLVADWNGGEINVLKIDNSTGLAVDRTTGQPKAGTKDPLLVRFASLEKPWSSGAGPWSFAFDPLTNDLFVLIDSVEEQVPNTILQIGGFPAPDAIRGDFNSDRLLDMHDLDLLARAQQTNGPLVPFDLNSDGQVNLDDRRLWLASPEVGNTYVGDSNLDGEFNSGDLVQVFTAGEYEDDIPLNSFWSTGDWDGDGDFTTSDLVVAFTEGGYEEGPRQVVASPVPEPGATTFLLTGMFGVLALFRRRSLGT